MVVDSCPQQHTTFSKCDPAASKHAVRHSSHQWSAASSVPILGSPAIVCILVGNTYQAASWCVVTATISFCCSPATHPPSLSTPFLCCTTALLLFSHSPGTLLTLPCWHTSPFVVDHKWQKIAKMDVKYFWMKLCQLGANTLACIYESFLVGYQMGARMNPALSSAEEGRGLVKAGTHQFNILDQDQKDPDIWPESVCH